MATVLITGAAGFIGFSLARSLLADGHTVAGVDTFSPGENVLLKRNRAAVLRATPGYTGLEFSAGDRRRLGAVCARYAPDAVCHFAGDPGGPDSLRRPYDVQNNRLTTFLAVLEAARLAETQPRILYASSASVYGSEAPLPAAEETPANQPPHPEAAAHRTAERMAATYSRLYGLQTVGLRLFSVYGPWGRPDMAVWTFTEVLSGDRPVRVYNRGHMERDWIHIDDVVAAIRACLESRRPDTCELFNLGTEKSVPLIDVVHIVADALGKRPRMQFLPARSGEVARTQADIARARTKLDWNPAVSAAEGIPHFVTWYLHYRDIRQGRKGRS